MFRPSRSRNRRVAFVYSLTGCAVIAYSALHLQAAGASARPFEMVWSSFALLFVGANLWFALGVDRADRADRASKGMLRLPLTVRKTLDPFLSDTPAPRRRTRGR